MKITTILSTILVAAALARGADGKPNFTGDWKMNAEKSKFGALPPTVKRTDRIDHRDPSLKITRHQSSDFGESTYEYDCTTDGQPCKVERRGSTVQNLELKPRWDGVVLVFDGKGVFQGTSFTLTERWNLAADGKTIRLTRSFSGDAGATEQEIVLEKQ